MKEITIPTLAASSLYHEVTFSTIHIPKSALLFIITLARQYPIKGKVAEANIY